MFSCLFWCIGIHQACECCPGLIYRLTCCVICSDLSGPLPAGAQWDGAEGFAHRSRGQCRSRCSLQFCPDAGAAASSEESLLEMQNPPPTPELLNPCLHFNGSSSCVPCAFRFEKLWARENCSEPVTFLFNTPVTHVQGPCRVNRRHCRDTWFLRWWRSFSPPPSPASFTKIRQTLYRNVTPK